MNIIGRERKQGYYSHLGVLFCADILYRSLKVETEKLLKKYWAVNLKSS